MVRTRVSAREPLLVATVEPTTERWEFRAKTNDYRCRIHACEFERGEVCLDCIDEPGPMPGEQIGDETEHDRELARREAHMFSLGKAAHRYAREKMKEDPADAAKLLAEGTKLIRAANEIRERRAQREHERNAILHERQMSGLRGAH